MTPANPIVTRFAPSPSGHLHVGGARTALFCWAFARGRGGKFILRIEDTDQKRSSDAASVGFLKDLKWLGIDWDEGPVLDGIGGGDHGPYFQSERLDIYHRELQRLLDSGQAYYAFDTPAEIDAQRAAARASGVAFRYDGTAARAAGNASAQARIASGEAAVIRFATPPGPVTIVDLVLGEATIPHGEIDDFVIRKADGFPTYHFAVVVDDELMRVTHVLRAQEHFTNTAKHMLLQDALGFRRPIYAHLPVISNPDGSKMSKRDKDKVLRKAVADRKLEAPPPGTVAEPRWAKWRTDKNVQLELEDAQRLAGALAVSLPEINVDDFRRSGYLPAVICNFLALNGWSPGGDVEKFDTEFLKKSFDLARVVKTPAKFDRAKLLAFNCDAITGLAARDFVAAARSHGQSEHPEFMRRLTSAQFDLLASASQPRSKTLDDMFAGNRFLVLGDDAIAIDPKARAKVLESGTPSGLDHLRAMQAILAGVEQWEAAHLEAAVKAYADRAAAGELGKVAQPLRVALSGGTVSPPIFDTLTILGKTSVLARVGQVLAAQ